MLEATKTKTEAKDFPIVLEQLLYREQQYCISNN